MSTNVVQLQNLLNGLKDLDLPTAPVVKIVNPNRITVADQYDIRCISKAEAKKMSYDTLQALLKYANHYLHEVSGQFLLKTVKGRQIADFEEAGANKEIQNSIAVLVAELKKRKE